MPPPHSPKSGGFTPDDALLEFVRRHERGLIRYDPAHIQVERLIAQVAEAYPTTRILVVASHQNDVIFLDKRLRERGLQVGRAFYGHESPGTCRVAVTTLSCVGTGLADAANRDMVFYLSPAEAFGETGILGLGHWASPDYLGSCPKGCNCPIPSTNLVTAVFGEESVSIPKHGRMARPVQVALVPSRWRVHYRGEDALAARRRLVWHHPVRNRRIAEIAQALARGDYDKLDRRSPGLGRAARQREDGSIGILVESVEHALALRRHLPGWRVLAGEGAITEGLSPSDVGRVATLSAVRRLATYNAIVTAAAMPEAACFDIIIRADAGVDLPALGGPHLLGHPNVEEDELLLVDFDDRHHPLARKWTRSRKAAYVAAGWYIAGGPSVYAEDRLHAGRIQEAVLPYQTPLEYRRIEGTQRTAKHHYEARRERRREKLRQQDGGQITLRQVADPDHLVDSFRKLVREGGPAAGIDGVSPRDISMPNFGQIAGKLSKAILGKQWRPQKTRPQPIPKPGTDEKRVLKIGVTLDRVVGKALHEALQPFWERVYLRHSFGFRRGRSVWQMLAEIEATMDKYQRHVLVTADVRKAFDNVPIQEALKTHQTAISNKSRASSRSWRTTPWN